MNESKYIEINVLKPLRFIYIYIYISITITHNHDLWKQAQDTSLNECIINDYVRSNFYWSVLGFQVMRILNDEIKVSLDFQSYFVKKSSSKEAEDYL